MKKRADGRYVKVITDPKTKKRISFYGKSAREVNQKALEYEEKKNAGKTFRDVVDEWWRLEVEKLEPSTVAGYRGNTERLLSEWGKILISDINSTDINRFLISLAKKGYAKKTVKNHKIIINRVFHFAIVCGYISVNAAANAEIPRNLPETKRKPATVREEGIIRESSDVWLLPIVALATGMRKGELLGLRWEDVDLDNNLIYVRRSIWYKGGAHVKSPKTEAGVRRIPIIAPLREELVKHVSNPSHYVFGAEKPLSEKAYRYRYEKFKKETGINATAQQLRKSFATLAVDANVPPDVLKVIFGHKDIATTLNIYAEVRDYRIAEANDLLAAEFEKKR